MSAHAVSLVLVFAGGWVGAFCFGVAYGIRSTSRRWRHRVAMIDRLR